MDSISTWLTLIGMFATMQFTVVATVWAFSSGMNKKFTDIYDKIQLTLDLMIAKLEEHEKQDETRFSSVSDNIWRLRVQQAAHGKPPSNTAMSENAI